MKAMVKETGEIIEVSRTENIITKRGVERQYVDNKRDWCTYVQSDLEFIKEELHKDVDWEQRRYEIAKAAMQGILSNEEEVDTACSGAKYKDNETHTIPKSVAQFAVACADALIAELKKEGGDL